MFSPQPTLQHGRTVLWAEERKAYTIVGRIPFRQGKIRHKSSEILVQGDPLLRRPYVVVVANPLRWPEARYESAKVLAAYLRSPETQAWLAEFGRGKIDDKPLFFPCATLR